MAPRRAVAAVVLALVSARGADGLANGLGKTPPLGWCAPRPALPHGPQPATPGMHRPPAPIGSAPKFSAQYLPNNLPGSVCPPPSPLGP